MASDIYRRIAELEKQVEYMGRMAIMGSEILTVGKLRILLEGIEEVARVNYKVGKSDKRVDLVISLGNERKFIAVDLLPPIAW